MSRIEKLKITTFLVPYTIEDDKTVSTDINTENWKMVEEEDFEIDADKENIQLRIKEHLDKMKQYNGRQELFAINDKSTSFGVLKKKILQRNRD